MKKQRKTELDPSDLGELLEKETSSMTEKQRRVYESAILLIAENGFQGTSTSDIAKLAEVSEATIFKHFTTKKDLFLKIIMPLLEYVVIPKAISGLLGVVTQKYEHFDEMITALMKERLEFGLKHSYALKIILQELPLQPEIRNRIKKNFLKKIWPEAQKAIQHYQDLGQIRDLPPRVIIRMIITLVGGYLAASLLYFPDENWKHDYEIEVTAEILCRGLKP